MSKNAVRCSYLLAALLCACASSVPLDDKTASEHDAIAKSEEEQAAAAEAKYDSTRTELQQRCRLSKFRGEDICWFSVVNPTAQHLEDAKVHRRAAEEHRAASASLRRAEAEACVGISSMDRDMSPLRHREEVLAVSDIPDGARLEIGPTPGLDEEKLQRLVDCHLARNAAVGWEMPEMSYCPLAVRGATAHASKTDKGFAVEVHGGEPETVATIRTRAQGATAH
jgi:hypothetical protein